MSDEERTRYLAAERWVRSLIACVGLSAKEFLLRHHLPIEGLCVRAQFAMTSTSNRLVSVAVEVELPERFPESQREALLQAVEHCTMHSSVRGAPEVRMELLSHVRAA
jgi:putative redox protein